MAPVVKSDNFLAMTTAKVTRKKAKQDKTMMTAISHDSLSAVLPDSDHSFSLDMHLKKNQNFKNETNFRQRFPTCTRV